jgi:hypothetical protein
MMWHCCHLFTKSLKPMSGSRDKMRLVPLNTPRDIKIDPQVCSPKKSGVALRFPPHSKTFFGLHRQSEATTALFPHALTPEGEKHGAFVQVLPVQNG